MAEDSDYQLDQVAEEFVSHYRITGEVDIARYCERYPEIAADIQELFPALLRLEQARPAALLNGSVPPTSLLDLHEAPLGDYRLVRELGRGGMGVVYEAVQESLGRRVALKVLAPWTVRDPRQIQRFEREARAAAQLHHTNIVPVLGVGTDRGIHYLVMQLIQGCALDEVLTALRSAKTGGHSTADSPAARSIAARLFAGDLPGQTGEPDTGRAASPTDETVVMEIKSGETRRNDNRPQSPVPSSRQEPARAYWHSIAAMGLQAAEGLAYAHRQGVVHRDIKPSNLLIDAQGNVWVADFGLAKTADSVDLTMSGELLGTVRYLPPERLRGISDARGDIYGLGATLYELTTLRPPFADADNAALLRQINEVDPPRPRSIDRTIPRDLETIIVKAMAKGPVDRYESPAELAQDLRLFLQELPIGARRITAAERLWRACKRRPAVAIPTFVAALLLVVIAVGSTLAAAWLRHENQLARDAEHRALESERSRRVELFRAHLMSAQGLAGTGSVGQQWQGLQAVHDAVDVIGRDQIDRQQAFSLIDAAIPCLTKLDIAESYRRPVAGRFEEVDVDPDFVSYADSWSSGTGAVVAPLGDPTLRTEFPGDPNEVSGHSSVRRFSRSGHWLIECAFRSREGESKHARIWDRESRRLCLDLTAEGVGRVFDFHPDDRHVLIVGVDWVLRVFDLVTGQVVRQSPRQFRATDVQYSRDGKWLALIGANGLAEIIDMADWNTLQVLTDVPEAAAIAFHPDDSLIVATRNGGLYHWRIEQRRGRFLKGHRNIIVHRLRISADGRFLASSGDGITQLRDLNEDQPVEFEGYAVGFSPDGKQFAVYVRNQLVVNDILASNVVRSTVNPFADSATFSPDGRWLAIGGTTGLGLYSTDPWKNYAEDLQIDHCGPAAFDPRGGALVTVGLFSNACYWPLQYGNSLAIGPPRSLVGIHLAALGTEPLAPQHQGRQAAFSADGRLVVADYRKGRLLMARDTDQPLEEFVQMPVAGRVAISPDGKWIAGAAVLAPQVQVWNAEDRTCVLDLPGHGTVAFSPDGQRLATRSATEVRLYRTDTWKLVRQIEVEASGSTFNLPLAFQPQGKLLAVAGPKQQVHLYDYESGLLIARLPHWENGAFSYLAFSPDGARLASVLFPAGFSVWNLAALQETLTGLSIPLEHRLSPSPTATIRADSPASVLIDHGPLDHEMSVRCWRRLADNEAAKQSWADAVHAMQRAMYLLMDAPDTTRAEALTRMGEYQICNGELIPARDSWQAALRLDPKSASAASSLARLLLIGPAEMQAPDQVPSLLAIVSSNEPNDPALAVLTGLVQIRQRELAAAIATLEPLEKNNDWQIVVAYALALAHAGEHHREQAQRSLDQANQLRQRVSLDMSPREQAELDGLQAEVLAALQQAVAGK